MKWNCKNCENAFESSAAVPLFPKCKSDDVKVS
jgi:Zn finger protein HypA/HybF involved in hydrogenase expression